ncbi:MULTISPECIES: glycerophosphodiester phosphodiesterase family protein [Allobacillus]|nr:glycerophosphodiester phosphodiesterase family protein [Allobacillus salarius]
MTKKDCLVIAHRGASKYKPENTLLAYDLALKIGVDYLELDVQLTKDQVPVVYHDSDLSKKTDIKGSIQDYTYEEIKNLDVGKWFGEEYRGTKLVNFETVLRLYGNQFNYFLEIKNPTDGIEQIIFNLFEKYRIDLTNHRVVIQSFDQNCLLKVREMDANIPINQLILKKTEEEMPYSLTEISTYAEGLGINQSNVNEQLLSEANRIGLKIYPYTVNDSEKMQQFIDMGVTGIISDCPDLVKSLNLN